MNPDSRANLRTSTRVWIALILLSAGSLWASHSRAAAGALLALAGTKALLVGWHYMGLREAHPAWRLGMAALLGGILGAVLLLSR